MQRRWRDAFQSQPCASCSGTIRLVFTGLPMGARALVLRAAAELPDGAAGLGDGVLAALRRLYGDGAEAGELMDLARPDGPTGMTRLMYALRRLAHSGALGARLS